MGCPNYNNLFCSYIAGVELPHFVNHAKFDKSLFVLTVAQTHSHQSVAFGVIPIIIGLSASREFFVLFSNRDRYWGEKKVTMSV